MLKDDTKKTSFGETFVSVWENRLNRIISRQQPKLRDGEFDEKNLEVTAAGGFNKNTEMIAKLL